MIALPPAPGRRIALLVGGLSLRDHWNAERAAQFDLVVAVNGAAFVFPCDYAALVDRPIVLRLIKHGPHPRKALLTYAKAYRNRFLSKQELASVTMIEIPTVGPRQKSYTMPRALLFCYGLAGASGSIEIFGMDFRATGHDVAGIKGYHEPKRWMQEATVLRSVWRKNIVAVHGAIAADKLAFIKGECNDWPG